MKQLLSTLSLLIVFAASPLLASHGGQLFYEMQPEELQRISQATNQQFEQAKQGETAWFGLVFESALTIENDGWVGLKLSAGVEVYLEREQLESHPMGFLVWTGDAFNKDGYVGRAQFILNDGAIEGHVSVKDQFLVITSLGNSIHRISLEKELFHSAMDVITNPVLQEKGSYAACLGKPNLTLASDFCYGYTSASWNAISGATYYELRVVNGGLLYSGSLTSKYVNFGCCTNRYLHVRACDSSGCGDYSASKFARYYSICL